VVAAARRIAEVPLALAVTSPLQRCVQTTTGLLASHTEAPPVQRDRGLLECDYGEWQGEKIVSLARRKLWRTVQEQPSAVVFPGGESLAAMQARSVAAVRRHDAAVEAAHGPDAVWLAVTHGDIIKSILADALGMHLDLFQRLHVDPASLSVVNYTTSRPFVHCTNTQDGDLSWLRRPARRRTKRPDALVGGGAGPA
jgi:probable phosphomutase (TIGR03848 family)